MLEPLRQWICDTCGEIIQSPEQGYVEWMETNDKRHGFRIVHHASHSPRKGIGGDCYYGIVERGGDGSLTDFVGARGLLELTSWIDVGEWHDSKYSEPEVDLREWTTLFRRLHAPYYEEARHCTQELRDELDCGADQIYLYLPDTLKRIVEEHESRRPLKEGEAAVGERQLQTLSFGVSAPRIMVHSALRNLERLKGLVHRARKELKGEPERERHGALQ
jgi:hypothetical protein